jgi:hypothetical protein
MKPESPSHEPVVPHRKQAVKPLQPAAEDRSESSRLCVLSLKIDRALRREIDAYAEANGVSRSRAASHYLEIARETIREREGVPSGRADELMEAVDGVRAAMDILGPPTFGMLRLLAHWASQTRTVPVSEDELLAELRSVGADEWEQAIGEAERDLQETDGDKGPKGSS